MSEEEELTRRLMARIGHVTHSRKSIVLLGQSSRRKGASISPMPPIYMLGDGEIVHNMDCHSHHSKCEEDGASCLFPAGRDSAGRHGPTTASEALIVSPSGCRDGHTQDMPSNFTFKDGPTLMTNSPTAPNSEITHNPYKEYAT
ncbi:hypothetical protein CEUSTIGMA_g4690.t1 [Chlamydomonas eustigma]|uniref:Uncharacterized protein n=1 Tax=Chlamydomonas eustigma TaxID=1157962 RepID=A0A250X2C0_9CHLO|nr:hypothetical protein CEUSTIGMA_g4690.t1 [Chlamydomonas eustigma]|eukprot:GAX77244.1 hypothetical protein CEUSTIGMA_g4690.t1 [Chlamydomonas eustigma]